MRLDARVRAYLAGPPLGGVRMYAAPTPLAVGEGVPGGSLARKLDRLGYRPVTDPTHALAPGEYRAAGTTLELAERPSPVPGAAAPRRVRVGLDGARLTEMEDLEAGALDRLEVEPEVLAVLGGGGATLGASPELPPPACRSAVLAAEDRHFFLHPGVDPVAIARALVADLRAHHVAQGASTLTQQLVKNAFLSPRRTLSRKLREAVLALLLEARASKEEILARYVASVYLGVDGGLPVHGFSEAAQVYFGKPLGELEPAERATRRGLAALERGRRRRAPLQAALVALDPHTGRVRALVGGRDYGSSPLDRAVRSRRQPGSAFKPFVYVAALDPTRRGVAAARTVVSPVEDEPLSVRVGARGWEPGNYGGTFAGTIPLEDALAESRNAATVRVALDVGLDAVARAAADLGIASPLPRVPALALGVAETSLLELTAAYGVFARGGVRRPPTLVVAVASADGETLYAAPPEEERVLAPGVAYLVTHLLEGVIDRGTGRPAREAGLTGSAAGKTGTTDDTRDAWFVGFTPEVVAGVWVGLDGGGPTGLTGAQGALPIWTDFVRVLVVGTAHNDRVAVGVVVDHGARAVRHVCAIGADVGSQVAEGLVVETVDLHTVRGVVVAVGRDPAGGHVTLHVDAVERRDHVHAQVSLIAHLGRVEDLGPDVVGRRIGAPRDADRAHRPGLLAHQLR